jgi:hypothetical protein
MLFSHFQSAPSPALRDPLEYSDPAAIVTVTDTGHSAGMAEAMGLGQFTANDSIRTQLLTRGLPGVLLGAGAMTGLTALAFHVRDPKKPKWGPAFIVGGGSFALGALALALTAVTLEPNIAAISMGVAFGK